MASINTPQNRLGAIIVLLLMYLALPGLFAAYLYYSLGRGFFPPEGDSIGLPFAAFLFLWIICFPIVTVTCFLIEVTGRVIATAAREDIAN